MNDFFTKVIKNKPVLIAVIVGLILLVCLIGKLVADGQASAYNQASPAIEEKLQEIKQSGSTVGFSKYIAVSGSESDKQIKAIDEQCSQAESLSAKASEAKNSAELAFNPFGWLSTAYNEASALSKSRPSDNTLSDISNNAKALATACKFYVAGLHNAKANTKNLVKRSKLIVAYDGDSCKNKDGCLPAKNAAKFKPLYTEMVTLAVTFDDIVSNGCYSSEQQAVCDIMAEYYATYAKLTKKYYDALPDGNYDAAARKIKENEYPVKAICDEVNKVTGALFTKNCFPEGVKYQAEQLQTKLKYATQPF